MTDRTVSDYVSDLEQRENAVLKCITADGTRMDIGCIPLAETRDDGSRNVYGQVWVVYSPLFPDKSETVTRDGVRNRVKRCMPDVELISYGESLFAEE